MKRSLFIFFSLALISGGYAQSEISVEEVILASLQKNYEIKLKKNEATPAHYEGGVSYGVLLPRANAQATTITNSNNNRTITASNVETLRSGVESSNLSGSVQLVWTLFDGTKMFATRKRLNETAELAEINIKAQVNSTVADVINTYFGIVKKSNN